MSKSNIILFPTKKEREQVVKDKEISREASIRKGIAKCVEKMEWVNK